MLCVLFAKTVTYLALFVTRLCIIQSEHYIPETCAAQKPGLITLKSGYPLTLGAVGKLHSGCVRGCFADSPRVRVARVEMCAAAVTTAVATHIPLCPHTKIPSNNHWCRHSRYTEDGLHIQIATLRNKKNSIAQCPNYHSPPFPLEQHADVYLFRRTRSLTCSKLHGMNNHMARASSPAIIVTATHASHVSRSTHTFSRISYKRRCDVH